MTPDEILAQHGPREAMEYDVAIVGAGLRAVFGLGRSGRSKILPWGSVILAVLPAVVAIAIRVLAGDIIELYNYQNYLWEIGGLLPIFLAAQAPELAVNDMVARTSTRQAPWHLIAANDKNFARVEVLRVAADAIEQALGRR